MTLSLRTRTKAKSTFIPKTLVSLPALLKKRTKSKRIQAIKSELAARTLYVVDGEDIIITSLDRKPFCCQEELSIMARPELCRVARELNQKLPRALRIELVPNTPSEVLRVWIEEMMGFRHLRNRTKVSPIDAPQVIQVNALSAFAHERRGRRSPASSFSSASSRSSAPYGLAVVNEMDEEFGEMSWAVSASKNGLGPMFAGRQESV